MGSMAPLAARSIEASSVNSYLRKIDGAISRTGESARRAQARPGQHLGRADTELRRCRDEVDKGNCLPMPNAWWSWCSKDNR